MEVVGDGRLVFDVGAIESLVMPTPSGRKPLPKAPMHACTHAHSCDCATPTLKRDARISLKRAPRDTVHGSPTLRRSFDPSIIPVGTSDSIYRGDTIPGRDRGYATDARGIDPESLSDATRRALLALHADTPVTVHGTDGQPERNAERIGWHELVAELGDYIIGNVRRIERG